MNTESFLKQRLLCIAVVDDPEAAMPLAEALLAGGLKNMEIPFRTAAAAESIRRIGRNFLKWPLARAHCSP